MTTGTKIFWKGDFSNGPKTGVVVSYDRGMVSIRWDDGSSQSVPDFTILPNYGWVVG